MFYRVNKPKSPQDEFFNMVLTCYSTAADAKSRNNPERIKVEHIAGNMTHQTMFQINGSYLVSMLDAYSELNNEELPDTETHEAFCNTVAEKIEKYKDQFPGLENDNE